MPQLEPLHLKLTGSADGLTAALGQAHGSIGGFASGLTGKLGGLTGKIGGLAAAFNPVAGKLGGLAAAFNPVALAATAAFAGITAAAGAAALAIGKIREAMNSVDEANDAANRIGVSFAERSQLQIGLREATGADAGTIDAAIAKLQVSLADAAKEGSGKAFEVLQKLGLDAGELLSMGPLKQIEMLATRISGVNDRSTQTAMIFDLLGRQGMAIAAAFRQSPEGLKEAAAWAEKNLSLTQQQVEQIGMAQDVWGRVGDKIEAVFNQVAADLAPAMQMIGEDVLSWIDYLSNAGVEVSNLTDLFAIAYGLASDFIDPFEYLLSLLDPIVEAFKSVWDWLEKNVQLVAMLETALQSMAPLLPDNEKLDAVFRLDGLEDSLARLKAIREEALGRDRSGISDAEAEALEKGGQALEKSASAAKEGLLGLSPIFQGVMEGVGAAVDARVKEAQSTLDQFKNQGRESPLKAVTDRAEQIRVVAERENQSRDAAMLEKLTKELEAAREEQKKTNALLKEIKENRGAPPLSLD